jgi:hypothetical protein
MTQSSSTLSARLLVLLVFLVAVAILAILALSRTLIVLTVDADDVDDDKFVAFRVNSTLAASNCVVPPNATLVFHAPSLPYHDIERFLRRVDDCGDGAEVYETDRHECQRAAHIVAYHVRDLAQPITSRDEPRFIAQLDTAATHGRPRFAIHQAWLAVSYEGADWTPSYLANATMAAVFDALFVHETGRILVSRTLPNFPVPSIRDRTRSILHLVSDCSPTPSGRQWLLPRMIEQAAEFGLRVESRGRCWPSADNDANPLPTELSSRDNASSLDTKARVLQHFRFELIVANALCDNFIDEKVLLALLNGAIPIYLGVPNWKDLEPRPEHNSIIHMGEFRTTSELWRYVATVANDEALQARFHEWRQHAPIKPWPLGANDERPIACRMADWRGVRDRAKPVKCAGKFDQFIEFDGQKRRR